MNTLQIKKEIQQAKQIADVVVLSLHFGTEYERLPNAEQVQLAKDFANQGADIIIGTHPHVLQPMTFIEREDGQRSLVIYSLGNFLSAQDKLYTKIGGIARIQVVKSTHHHKSRISLQHPTFLPTYTTYHNWRDFRVIPLQPLANRNMQYKEIQNI
ncbi:CapA family protein [Bacillus toyonensis]|uniref:CapA family protein n=1 Tax=Bacillus toyonensis TaxID=155322 RepID=UPI00211D867B|nr:CapA family protein [Bacillus toyonensis]